MRALPLVKRCGEDFAAMKDGHCARCSTRVHDLSKASEAEAAEILASRHVECVRFAVDRRGNMCFRVGVAGAVAITIAASSVALASSPPEPSHKSSPSADAGDAAPDVEYFMGKK